MSSNNMGKSEIWDKYHGCITLEICHFEMQLKGYLSLPPMLIPYSSKLPGCDELTGWDKLCLCTA